MAPTFASSGYTVIVPDLPGTGDSAALPDGHDDKEAVVDALRPVVGELVGNEPLRVVGHDIGGMVALAWARSHPDDVVRLAVVETGLPGLGLEEAMDVARGGRWHHGFFMTPQVPAMLVAGHEEEFFTWWFGRLAARQDAFPPTEIAATTAPYRGRAALDRSFAHYRTLLRDGRVTAAWLEDGGRLTMPVAGVGGELSLRDHVGRALARAASDVRTMVVADSGHFPAEEQPAAFLDHLRPFLADDP
ncbi:epoxide hydrolase [Actinomycetospora sp. NBRC 106375]|nr:epoxide hydrolase [Actinomycetospora sp. NBRC 106375]